jgi:hypothetical protein
VPATMTAGIMALPLAMVGFERSAAATQWIGTPPAGRRILLVDDGCSTGQTMAAVREALLGQGRQCLTLAVVHDPEVTTYVPDLSHAMRSLWRFPWERGEATPAGRALRATGAGPDRATELPFYGLDLDAPRPIGSALGHGWRAGAMPIFRWCVGRRTSSTRPTWLPATRPKRRRAGDARISSRATPSRHCGLPHMRRTWW